MPGELGTRGRQGREDTAGEGMAGPLYQDCGLGPLGCLYQPRLMSSLGPTTVLQETAASRVLSFSGSP